MSYILTFDFLPIHRIFRLCSFTPKGKDIPGQENISPVPLKGLPSSVDEEDLIVTVTDTEDEDGNTAQLFFR